MMGRFKHGPTMRWVALAAAATALAFCNANACESRAETRAQAANSPATAGAFTRHRPKPWAPPARTFAKTEFDGVAATGAGAATPDKTAVMATSTSTVTLAAQSGMVVGIDPETGILGMPTAAQMRSLFPLGVSAFNQSDVGLPITHGPGDAVGVDLQGRFQEYYIIRTGPDGRRAALCLDDPAAIKKALETPLTSPASAPARYEEK